MVRYGNLVCGALDALAAGGCVLSARADPFPARPATIVVPYPISGPADVRGTSRMSRSYRMMAPHAPPAITDSLARIAERAIRSDTTQPVVLARQPGGQTTRGAISSWSLRLPPCRSC